MSAWAYLNRNVTGDWWKGIFEERTACPKADQSMQEQCIGRGGYKAEKAGGVTLKCRQQGAIGVNSDPRLVLEVYGLMLHWGKDYTDICWRYTF